MASSPTGGTCSKYIFHSSGSSFDQYRRLRDEWETLLKSDHEAREKMLKEMEQLRQENVLLERKFSTMKNASLLKLESVCLSAEENIDNLLKQVKRRFQQICR